METVTPELKAQMTRIARERGYTLSQLQDPVTMSGLMKDGLAALDKLCMEAVEGRTDRGRKIVDQVCASVWLDIRWRGLSAEAAPVFG